jgi:hypothetical protein
VSESGHGDGTDIVTTVRRRIGLWGEALARETKAHPGRSVALALGAGFLLGGGLFSPFTARVVAVGMRAGLRMAVVPLLTQGILAAINDIPTTKETDQ